MQKKFEHLRPPKPSCSPFILKTRPDIVYIIHPGCLDGGNKSKCALRGTHTHIQPCYRSADHPEELQLIIPIWALFINLWPITELFWGEHGRFGESPLLLHSQVSSPVWLLGKVERTARAPNWTCRLCQRVKRKRCSRLWTELWARTSWSPTPAATWPPRCPRLGPSSRATWRWSCRCSWWLWSSWWWPGTRWSSWLLLWIKPWEIKATTSFWTLPYLIFSSVSRPPLHHLLLLLLLLLHHLSLCSVYALKFGPISFVPSSEWKPTRSLFAHAPYTLWFLHSVILVTHFCEIGEFMTPAVSVHYISMEHCAKMCCIPLFYS